MNAIGGLAQCDGHAAGRDWQQIRRQGHITLDVDFGGVTRPVDRQRATVCSRAKQGLEQAAEGLAERGGEALIGPPPS
jgi:hypothetical protein